MSSSQCCSLAFVAVLAGCQTTGGHQASSSNISASPSAAIASAGAISRGDIVAKGGDISLGRGWYRYETYKGRSFRWVDNDATFVVDSKGPIAKLAVTLEAGPGLPSTTFTLDVLGQDGRVIAYAPVTGQQRVRFDLPAQAGQNTYRLHVAGGGKRIATDPRILNFRVFRIADAAADATIGAGHPDIVTGSGSTARNRLVSARAICRRDVPLGQQRRTDYRNLRHRAGPAAEARRRSRTEHPLSGELPGCLERRRRPSSSSRQDQSSRVRLFQSSARAGNEHVCIARREHRQEGA